MICNVFSKSILSSFVTEEMQTEHSFKNNLCLLALGGSYLQRGRFKESQITIMSFLNTILSSYRYHETKMFYPSQTHSTVISFQNHCLCIIGEA